MNTYYKSKQEQTQAARQYHDLINARDSAFTEIKKQIRSANSPTEFASAMRRSKMLTDFWYAVELLPIQGPIAGVPVIEHERRGYLYLTHAPGYYVNRGGEVVHIS